MLEVKNLVKSYKTTKSKTKDRVIALNDVSISFPEKGLVFLLGKSGSGKSTLLNTIGGLDSFDSGEIIIKGKSSKDFTQADFDSYRNTFIGFIFQEYNVLEEFTVAKNLSMALELQGKKATKNEVNRLLEQVEMLEFSKRKPNQLSGGQKQRVAIARALIKNPEIIMADEPTGALDSNTGKQVMETLKKLSKEKLVIIVSHDREFAEIYGDRIVELKDGKIISDVTKREVEPLKTESGISLIDNKIIHIRKGTQITSEDISAINNAITNNTANTDILISLDEKSNNQMKKISSITEDGNREVFLDTTADDINKKTYNPKDFKLIKSHLHFKDSLKMGASALKSKVAKLVFTILLSCVAFVMFGLVDTLSAFNRANAVFTTLEITNEKELSLLKEREGDYRNFAVPLKASDIEYLNEKYPGISIQPVVNRGISFDNSWGNSNRSSISIEGLDNDTNHIAYQQNFSGFVDINQEKLNKLGFTLIGDLPSDEDEDGKTQICISKHLYNCIKHNNDNLITSEQQFLEKYNSCHVNDDKAGVYIYDYKVVGIIDNHKDYSEFYNIDEKMFDSSSGQLLRNKIRATLDYGYDSMIYTTESVYNSYLDKKLNVVAGMRIEGKEYLDRVELQNTGEYHELKNNYHTNLPEYYYDDFNHYYTIKDNGQLFSPQGPYDLADDEIIIQRNYLDELGIYGDLNEYVENEHTIKIRNTDSSDSPVINELKVVGYFDYSFNISTLFMVNENTKSQLITDDYYYIFNGDNTVYTASPVEKSQILTPSEEFYSHYKFNAGCIYYKGQEDYSGDINLTGNEIVINPNHLMPNNYNSHDEALEGVINKLKEGDVYITLTESEDTNSKDIATFKVVGLSYNYTLVSRESYDTHIKNRLTGYDYCIAMLSDDSSVNKAFIKECENFNENNIKFTVQNNATTILDSLDSTIKDITSILVWVALGLAIFASLMLMSFITTSISYKKREIGILRALGARGSDVFGIFFKESLIIALINFALAFTGTAVGAFFINKSVITDLGIDLALLSVSIRQFGLILGISVLAAFIASILPVSKISRKKPIDAINNR